MSALGLRKTVSALSALLLLATVASAQKGSDPTTFTGVSLKILNETVPPGGTVQMKVSVTEPKPITKGSAGFTLSRSLGALRGIAIDDPNGTASGVGVYQAGGLRVNVTSPLSTLGTVVDYPVITVTLPVKSTVAVGTKIPLTMDGATSLFIDPSGAVYPQEVTPGTLTVGGKLFVSNVVPGGGFVPGGSTVSIYGGGFDSKTKVQVNEVKISSQKIVSSSRIDLTLGQGATMDARRVRVTTGTGATTTYYSYLRTTNQGTSSNTLLAASEPIFSRQRSADGYLTVANSTTRVTGLALQNPNPNPTVVVLKLLSSKGAVLHSAYVTLPGYSRMVRAATELFPSAVSGYKIHASSSVPLQMLGLLTDTTVETVVPASVSTTP
jgi:hypothetical protein